jgi:hypothetical protein
MFRLLLIIILGTFSLVLSAQSSKEIASDNSAVRAEMMIYPNPANDFVTISFNENADQILIYNLIGKKVKIIGVQNREERININDLPAGIYIAQLIGKNNRVLASQRIQKR